MSRLAHALLAVALVSTALVAAAPTAEKSVRKASSLTQAKSASVDPSKKLRRGKRQVLVQEVSEEEDESEMIRQQLSELSDDQLVILADIVQSELQNYEEQPQEEYEIIEIPDEMLQDMVYPRDRRSMPVVEIDDQDLEENEEESPELVVLPEEALEEALAEQEDDIELRMRIAEMAQILNERATRRRYL